MRSCTRGLRLESFAQNAVQEQVQEEDQAVQVSLSDAALDTQNQANRIATLNVGAAEQSLQDSIQQTEAGLDSNDFTRIVDDNRERDDASNIESRQTRELGHLQPTQPDERCRRGRQWRLVDLVGYGHIVYWPTTISRRGPIR